MLNWQRIHSKQDILGPDFIAHTYSFHGSVSYVATTLIEHNANPEQERAILYLHGYTDYFHQAGLAQHFTSKGLRFFALDLQGYGRSIRPNSKPNWCESMAQYHDDIHIALAEVSAKGIKEIVILAHSTGGLIVSSYLAKIANQTTAISTAQAKISGLILNSPFLELPFPPKVLKRVSWPIRIAVSLLPFHSLRAKKISTYAQTLHKAFAGEWEYRLDWKPAHGFPLSFSWLKQIIVTQHNLRHHCIHLPTLMCHSARSNLHAESLEAIRKGDGVLDVESMKMAAKRIFPQLCLASIEGGFHDLYLSPTPIRANYLNAIDDWLKQQKFITVTSIPN